jgi:hypothetical protein
MPLLDVEMQNRLTQLALALINQQRARVIVKSYQPAPGFWFGGGNLIETTDGVFYLVGRYRNAGDSRAGLAVGERGLELAVFASTDRGQSFEKMLSFTKCDLDVGNHPVLSIEGSALRHTNDGIELFISTEKDHTGYPPGFENYLKPETGVWSIDRLAAGTIDGLRSAPRIAVAARRLAQGNALLGYVWIVTYSISCYRVATLIPLPFDELNRPAMDLYRSVSIVATTFISAAFPTALLYILSRPQPPRNRSSN